jgi:hypothetical protein
MVLVDDHRNRWRHLVLPLAHQDPLIEAAVLSAATFHFTTNVNSQLIRSDAVYQGAIRSLRWRQDLSSRDLIGKQSILLCLLLLLVSTIVNGSSDFRTIFKLLESCLSALGGEENISQGELGTFVVWQIRK